jgi:hypothetical protein
VALNAFQEAQDFIKKAKNVLLGKIKHAMEIRLEVAENKVVIHAVAVLNTEGWEQYDEDGEEDLSFADNVLEELYNHFKDPLSQAGLLGSLHDLIKQWHGLVNYTKRFLNPSRTPYLRVWRRIFDFSLSEDWNIVLFLVELLFSIPISNAKVERLFS